MKDNFSKGVTEADPEVILQSPHTDAQMSQAYIYLREKERGVVGEGEGEGEKYALFPQQNSLIF